MLRCRVVAESTPQQDVSFRRLWDLPACSWQAQRSTEARALPTSYLLSSGLRLQLSQCDG